MSPNQQPITAFLIIHAVPELELAVPTKAAQTRHCAESHI